MANYSSWSYSNQHTWVDNKSCKRQSPINITSWEKGDQYCKPIVFNGGQSLNGTWTNTGRSLQFNPSPDTTYIINTHKGGYTFNQFHFHWGQSPGQGSEHLVNSTSQDAELHFVHSKIGGTPTDPDYLTVIGVLLKRHSTMPIKDTIWEQLAQVPPNKDTTIELNGLNITHLLPTNKSYWYYEGSLTTPPCSEIVQWHVYKEVLSVPEGVIEAWSTAPSLSLPCNFRHVQDINDRKIWSFEQGEH